MYLSKLELVGFKSFAQKTRFKFSEGITVFVGPNGCGKTNIVDAVRWVLGEQKTSLLRSDAMENVIFCGTKERKPIGMAEVSLTIENNKKILPIEYNEVTITRRLFRNGESQYLINNTICRLRDIQDLFMDTGIGSDSYSVIELKMVEELLNGKIEERRHLLEEAAGVTKYKVRRKEADKKLVSVRADLVRLQDIVEEIKKNVASLSKQAQKTKKYNQIIEEYKKLELSLLKKQYIKVKEEILFYENNLKEQKITKNDFKKSIEESEENIKKIENELTKLNELNVDARNNETRLYNELSQMNKDIAVGEERIASLKKYIEVISKDIDNISDILKTHSQKTLELEKDLELYKEELKAKLTELEKHRNFITKQRQIVNEHRNSYNRKNDELKELQNQSFSNNSIIDRNKQRLEINIKRIDNSTSEIQNLKTLLSKAEEENKRISINQEKLLEEKYKLKEIYDKNIKLRDDLNRKIEKIQQKITEIKNEIYNKKHTIDFLRNLISSDESSKFLIESKEWLPSSDKIILAEIIAVDEKYSIAVESALSEAGKWFIVDKIEEAESAYFLLKEKSKGKATFVVNERIPEAQALERIVFNDKEIKWISEIIRTEPKFLSLIRLLLGRTCICETIEEAYEIISHGIADAGVTIDGDYINRNCIVKWGSVSSRPSELLGKREKLEKLTKEVNELEEQLKEENTRYEEEKVKFKSIILSEIEDKLTIINEELSNNDKSLSKIKYETISLNDKITLIAQNIKQLQNENEQLLAENDNLEKEVSELQNRIFLINEELSEKLKSLIVEEEALEENEQLIHTEEIAIAKLETEIKNLNIEIGNIEKQIKFNKDRQKDLELQKNKAHLELENTNRRLLIIQNELQTTESKYNEATGKREIISHKIIGKQEELRQLSDDLILKRKSYSKLMDNIHQIELKINENTTQLSNLIQKSLENYNVDIQKIELFEDEKVDIEEIKGKLAILKDKLSTIGNVNFIALEEYEEQSNRLNFFLSQIKDLNESEKTIQDTIKEINQTAENIFKETFIKIGENFKILFKKLFGEEGEAEIRLVNESEPLESDIEIIAKPPGKKPYSIDILSGGEKTLIAIALLFSIYLVKPSPFCILDEVDAPLDDSNIDKFLNLIKSFSENTQFLVITHNKKTMESADTLYGITMLEEGVSQVVSVKFAS